MLSTHQAQETFLHRSSSQGGARAQLMLNNVQLLLLVLLPAATSVHAVWYECNAQGKFGGTYGTEVLANLTEFRSNLLSHVWSSFDPDVPYLKGFKRFDPMNTFIQCPPGQPLEVYGKGDGTKRLCDLSKLRDPCIIYSLGSNGDFTFENDVLLATAGRCEVHTFDCTYHQGRSVHPRHKYHKICVGSKPGNPDFKTWAEITQMLGHNHRGVDVAKIDIEGYETSVLSELRHDMALPRQLVMEIHIKPLDANSGIPDVAARTPAQVALLFMHLASLGYGVTNREDNLWGHPGCCAEFAFLHVENQWNHGSWFKAAGRGGRHRAGGRHRGGTAGAAAAAGTGHGAVETLASTAASTAAGNAGAPSSGSFAEQQQLLQEAAAAAAVAAAAVAKAAEAVASQAAAAAGGTPAPTAAAAAAPAAAAAAPVPEPAALRVKRLVVSMTSFPGRAEYAAPTVYSIMHGKRKPDQLYFWVVLNISRISTDEHAPQMPGEAKMLADQFRDVVKVLVASKDYGPATKLLPTLEVETDPDTVIVTVDDDTYYHADTIFDLEQEMIARPGHAIIRSCESTWKNKTKQWKLDEGPCNGFMTAYASAAYRRSFWDDEVFNQAVAPPGCLHHDDIWFSGNLWVRGVPQWILRPHVHAWPPLYHRPRNRMSISHDPNTGDKQVQCLDYFGWLDDEKRRLELLGSRKPFSMSGGGSTTTASTTPGGTATAAAGSSTGDGGAATPKAAAVSTP